MLDKLNALVHKVLGLYDVRSRKTPKTRRFPQLPARTLQSAPDETRDSSHRRSRRRGSHGVGEPNSLSAARATEFAEEACRLRPAAADSLRSRPVKARRRGNSLAKMSIRRTALQN